MTSGANYARTQVLATDCVTKYKSVHVILNFSLIHQWYGNGQRLCNKLFGQNFRYVDPKCPCTKMDGPIPNHINETSTCNTATSTTVSSPTKPSSYCPRGKYSFHATYLSLVLIAMIKYWKYDSNFLLTDVYNGA